MSGMILSMSKESLGDNRQGRCDNEGSVCVIPPTAGLPYQYFLTTTGNGLGAISLASDFSGAPTNVYYKTSTRLDIYNLIITISDNANFTQTDFGAIAGGLTNGIKIYAGLGPQGGNVEVPLLSTNLRPIKRNYEWYGLTPHVSLTSFAGLSQTLIIDFDIVNEYGKVFPLDPEQSIIAKLNDNFSTLVDFTIGIRGTRYT